MNISDSVIDMKQYEGKDRLDVMFEKQEMLRDLYKVLGPKVSVADLDLPEHQHILREFAWNVCEETGEVLDVVFGTNDREHIIDETSDSLSFYLELLALSGMSVEDFAPSQAHSGDKLDYWFKMSLEQYSTSSIREIHSLFLEKLALAINNLKNRKWRKTNLKTNKLIYRKALYDTFIPFLMFVNLVGLTPETLFDGYLRKTEVNLFRINSRY